MVLFRPRNANGLRAIFLLVIFVSVGACERNNVDLIAQSVGTSQKSIINGDECLPGEHESAVELFIDAEIDFGSFGVYQVSSYLCGGTLIAPDVVLTAAHCLDPSELTYGIGKIKKLSYYVTWDSDLSYVDKNSGPAIPKHAVVASSWKIEEAYDSHRMEGTGVGNFHDVGLVFLKEPLKFKPAIVITKEEALQITKGAQVSIAGWGQRAADAREGSYEATLVGQKYCAKSFVNEVGMHELQVGSDEKSSRKCFGDSGGPTYMDVMTKNGLQTRVIGITSHAYDEAICLKGGLDTRVDAWLSWIDEKMREGCKSGARSWCKVEGIIAPDFGDVEAEPSTTDSYMTIATSTFKRFVAYIYSWLA